MLDEKQLNLYPDPESEKDPFEVLVLNLAENWKNRGKSDILYIGRTGDLQKRMKYLLKYFLPPKFAGNWGKHTARKALRTILDETDIKVYISYVVCDNYKQTEILLLQKYCKNHIETPPLNNQRR